MTSSHRTRLRPLTFGVALSTAALYSLTTLPAASAASLPVPTAATASATGEVAHVTALTVPLAGISALDASVAQVTGTVNAQAPRAVADARNIDGSLLTALPLGELNAVLADAHQEAPPTHVDPTTDGLIPPDLLGPLGIGVSNASAHARFLASGTCLPATVPLTTSTVSTADVDLLGIVQLPGVASTSQSTRLVDNGRAEGGRTVRSRVVGSTVDLSIGGQQVVKVLTAPELVVESDGTAAGTKATYTAPLISIGGQVVDLASNSQTLPADAGMLIELSAGELTVTQQSSTKIAAEATALHLKVTLGGFIDVAEIDLFPLAATATAPSGGVTCGTSPDTDGDGLTDDVEAVIGTDPTKPDTDGDGVRDGQEDADTDGITNLEEVTGSENDAHGNEPTDPTDADSDDDGLTDGQEIDQTGTDPNKADTDGDGSSDFDEDADSDGLTNGEEVSGSENDAHGNEPTDPTDADSDDGGVDDGAEIEAGTDPNDPSDDERDATLDTDKDGLTDVEEALIGTDPRNPDTDGDMLLDGAEVNTHDTDPLNPDTDGDQLDDGDEVRVYFTDPLDPDTDNDGLKDGREVHETRADPLKKDTDGDGLSDGREVKRFKTKPHKKDTDKDGLNDRVEVKGSANKRYDKCPTNPRKKDTDRDGLTDKQEIKKYKTNPCDKDTDNGGADDGKEVAAGSDPLDPSSTPNYPRGTAARGVTG